MAVSARDKRIVLTQSGNRCAFLKCNQQLVLEKTEKDSHAFVAEMAHVKGEKSGSARYDPHMTDAQRNGCDNIIVMCSTHHKVIDDQPEEYTVEKLLEMKKKHLEWVLAQTSKEITSVGFSELNIVTKFLTANTSDEYKIEVIAPKQKIDQNRLSPKIENLIKMGMAQVNLVRDYILKNPDTEFGDRLRQGFVEEYNRLVNERLEGDEIFESLLHFASGGSSDFKQVAAGLTVISYFFEKCDIFEK